MGAANSTVILSDEQNQQIQEAVDASVASWQASKARKGETYSDDSVSAFREYVAERVTKSVISGSTRNATQLAENARKKAARIERSSQIRDLELIARDMGVDFFVRRNYLLSQKESSRWNVREGWHGSPVCKVYRKVIANQGGAVFCSRPILDAMGHKVLLDISIAICRPDENFDLVEGMDLALKRFLRGYTLEFEYDFKVGILRAEDMPDKDLDWAITDYIHQLEIGFPNSLDTHEDLVIDVAATVQPDSTTEPVGV